MYTFGSFRYCNKLEKNRNGIVHLLYFQLLTLNHLRKLSNLSLEFLKQLDLIMIIQMVYLLALIKLLRFEKIFLTDYF